MKLSSDDLLSISLHDQAAQHLWVLNPAFFMWTWTVSLFLWASETDQSSKVSLLLGLLNCLLHQVAAPGRANGCVAGKPVAVTSNRGVGRVPRRAGTHPQLEQQYYQKKQSHPQPGEDLIPIVFVMERIDLDFSLVYTVLNINILYFR